MRVTMSGALMEVQEQRMTMRVLVDGRTGPSPQTYLLQGGSDLIRAQLQGCGTGDRLLLTGALTQIRVPLKDILGATCKTPDGTPMEDRILQVQVHKFIKYPGWNSSEVDMAVAHGRAAVSAEPTFWVTENGSSCWRGRIKTGPSDWFSAIAFGATADRLDREAQKGAVILVDWATPSNPSYIADINGHGRVVRHSPELVIRSFVGLI